MAKIAVPRTSLGLRRIEPAPVYSRIIGIELRVPGGLGNSAFCYTPKLGNRLLLRGVHFHADCTVAGAFAGGFLYIMSGRGVPQSGDAVATRWNRVIELHCGVKPGMRVVFIERLDLFWGMRRRYEFDEIRIAATMENFGANAFVATILFEISEG